MNERRFWEYFCKKQNDIFMQKASDIFIRILASKCVSISFVSLL